MEPEHEGNQHGQPQPPERGKPWTITLHVAVLAALTLGLLFLPLTTPTSASTNIEAQTTIEEAIANGEDEIAITVTAYDEEENPLSGVEITVSETDGVPLTDLADADTTDANGEANFTATSTHAGTATITFSDPNGNKDTATATFHPGPVTGFQIHCNGEANDDLTHAFANHPLACTLAATDAHNNPNPDYAGTANITTNATHAPNDEDKTPLLPDDYTFDPEDDQGTTTLTGFTFYKAETINITLEDEDDPTINGTSPLIRIHPEPQTPKPIETHGHDQNDTVAETLDSFTARFTDAFENPYTGHNVTFTVTKTPPGAQDYNLSATRGHTDDEGETRTHLTLGTTTGEYRVNATLNTTPPNLPTPPQEHTFLNVTFNATANPDDPKYIAPTQTPIETDADHQDPLTLEAQLEDIHGNPIPLPDDATVNWTLLDEEAGRIDEDQLTPGNTTGTYTITPTLEGSDLDPRSAQLIIHPGTPTSLQTEADTLRIPTNHSHTLQAHLIDDHGNQAQGILNWTLHDDLGTLDDEGRFHAQTPGETTITVNHDETQLERNITLLIATHVNATRIELHATLQTPHAGQHVDLSIDLYDADDTLIRGPNITPQLANPSQGYLPNPRTVIPTTPGTMILLASFEDLETQTELDVDPGPATQLAITPPVVAATPGETVNFTATPLDNHNNPLPETKVNWTLSPGKESSINATTGNLTLHPDEKNGTLQVTASNNELSHTATVHIANQTATRHEPLHLTAQNTLNHNDDNIRIQHTLGLERIERDATIEANIHHSPFFPTPLDHVRLQAATNMTKPSFLLEIQGDPLKAPPPSVDVGDLHRILDQNHDTAPVPFTLTILGTEDHTRMDSSTLNDVLDHVVIDFKVPEPFFEEYDLDPRALVFVEYSNGERTGSTPAELRVPVPLQGDYLYTITLESFSTFVAVSNQQGPQIMEISPTGETQHDPPSFTINLESLHPLDERATHLTVGNLPTIDGQDPRMTITRNQVHAQLDDPLGPGTYEVEIEVADTEGQTAQESWAVTIPCPTPTIGQPSPAPSTKLERANQTVTLTFDAGGCPVKAASAHLDGEPLTTKLSDDELEIELPEALLEAGNEHELNVSLENTEQKGANASYTYTVEEAIEPQDGMDPDEEEQASLLMDVVVYGGLGFTILLVLTLLGIGTYWGWKRYKNQEPWVPTFATRWLR